MKTFPTYERATHLADELKKRTDELRAKLRRLRADVDQALTIREAAAGRIDQFFGN